MNTFKELWRKFRKSKKYREEFVAAQVKRGIPFQIRALMKQKRLSQEKLAELSGLTQGAVSRAANPNYGNLTINTIIRVAAGLDMAFVGRFVPFSELGKWFTNLSEASVQVPTFEEEDEAFEALEKLERNGLNVLFARRKEPKREEGIPDSLTEKASGQDRKREPHRISNLLSFPQGLETTTQGKRFPSYETPFNISR